MVGEPANITVYFIKPYAWRHQDNGIFIAFDRSFGQTMGLRNK